MIRDNFTSHMSLKHAGIKPHVCEKCHKRFSYAASLREHQKICERRMLRREMKAQQAKIQPKCQVCGKEYSTEKTLKVHFDAVHKNAYDFECQICGKMFRYRASRDRHERTHMLRETNGPGPGPGNYSSNPMTGPAVLPPPNLPPPNMGQPTNIGSNNVMGPAGNFPV